LTKDIAKLLISKVICFQICCFLYIFAIDCLTSLTTVECVDAYFFSGVVAGGLLLR